MVVCKLKGGASAWWEQLQTHPRREGNRSIRSWLCMRQLLKGRFLPTDYNQILYQQYQQCQQRNRSVNKYTEELYRLNARNDLNETERQQVARYVGGLREVLQDQLAMTSIWKLSEAVNLAFKAESQVTRTNTRSSYGRKSGIESFPEKQKFYAGPTPCPSIPSKSDSSSA